MKGSGIGSRRRRTDGHTDRFTQEGRDHNVWGAGYR